MSAMLNDLIQSLHEIVQEAKAVPLSTDKCIINRNDVLYLIEDAIRCMPADIEKAREVLDSQEKIILDAKNKADYIIQNAQKQANAMVDRETIVLESEAKAKEIIGNAQTKSVEIKKSVTEFCADSLLQTEEKVALVLEELKTIRQNFKRTK